MTKRKRIKLSKDFYLNEFAVSKQFPELAKQITFTEVDHLKYFYLTKLILQPIRTQFNTKISITSGKRSKELNTKIGGSKTSQHMLSEAADWTFEEERFRPILLPQAFELIRTKLSRARHQVILYITGGYEPVFIHVSIISLTTLKKPAAMIHFQGKYVLWERGGREIFLHHVLK